MKRNKPNNRLPAPMHHPGRTPICHLSIVICHLVCHLSFVICHLVCHLSSAVTYVCHGAGHTYVTGSLVRMSQAVSYVCGLMPRTCETGKEKK